MNMNLMPVLILNKLAISLIVVVLILTVVLIALWFYGRKLQKRQAETEQQMEAVAQTVSMLVIDKKRMKMSEAGFPQFVVDQTPKMLRRSKVPVVKAKIGPKITSLLCDEKLFDIIPVKSEVKVVLSGIYIKDIKSARNGLEKRPEKKGFFKRLLNK